MEECKEVLTWEQKIQNIESAPEEARLMIAKAYIRDDIPDENVQYEFNTDSPEQLNEDGEIENLNADRILLFEFHNGQHYSNYRSALRMSPSYEVYKAGQKSKMADCTNIPISVMPKLIYEITHNGYSECKTIEEIKEDKGNTYEFKKSIDVYSYYDVAIRDKNNNIIGFVAVEWASERPEDVDVIQIERLAGFLEDKVNEIVENNEKRKKKKFLGIF